MSCLGSLCRMGAPTEVMPTNSSLLSKESTPNQWWRLPLSLFLHNGLLHMLLVVVLQLMLGWPIERTAGWIRVAFIYCTSGVMAILASIKVANLCYHGD